jgi:thiamine pyrophosphate-dependent acetolactate synthase large subunit-like protein
MAETATDAATQFHGGRLIARRLRSHGVEKLFTLSGGHLFPIYDGCRHEGIELIDVRHEQSAAFAAEGWAKVTRTVGVCALTAGPGVTNGMSAIASASQNHSPMLILGGRAPRMRWGQGSLQEIDHVPLVAPIAKFAATPSDTAEMPALVDEALRAAITPHSGPAFLDFSVDHVFMHASADSAPTSPLPEPWRAPVTDSSAVELAAALLRDAERPVVMGGTGLYWGRGEVALRELIEELRVPVFLNGLGRGCVPADHELFFSRARSAGLRGADVALVIGAPLDFRLGFGNSFAPDAEVIVLDVAEPERDHPRAPSAELYGPLPATIDALRTAASGRDGTKREREAWIASLRSTETEIRHTEQAELTDPRAPLHPMRIYGELNQMLDRDAVVIGDGGDFVSFAGRLIDSYAPGCWVDPGPYGCLGSGIGYALAAKLARPDRQVVLLLGDGAFGFSGMDLDTLARHNIPVTAIIGNNGIWALEKHPMEAIYGYSVAADLRPETRYDQLAQALGCEGELVRTPSELRPAVERAFESTRPTLINVITDPTVAYPRKSNLA